uniref:Peptidase S26 domain-containing protein n=1 Tax=mine drainage metagenome TaxID=410659 RepID=E6QBC0_9ZZZZ
MAARKWKRIISVVATVSMWTVITVGVLTMAVASLCAADRLSLNTTTCFPVGFYQRGDTPVPLKDGDMVYLCPPIHNASMRQAIRRHWVSRTSGGPWSCPGHLTPFLKKIVALPGQTVLVKSDGAWVDGKKLPNSQMMTTSPGGRQVIHMPYGSYYIKPGTFWDYAPGNYAYDSRYYGPVPIGNIIGSARAFLVIPGSQYWLQKGD